MSLIQDYNFYYESFEAANRAANLVAKAIWLDRGLLRPRDWHARLRVSCTLLSSCVRLRLCDWRLSAEEIAIANEVLKRPPNQPKPEAL